MNSITMTVIVENTVNQPGLDAEHGLSCWIKTDGGTLLWDTGQSGLLVHNARKLAIPLESTAHIALSHGHYDHTGGLMHVLSIAESASVYGHSNLFVRRYSKKGYAVHTIGCLVERSAVEKHCKSLILSDRPVEILPGVFTTGQIPRKTTFEDNGGGFYLDEECTLSDPTIDDQSLYIKTTEGIVVILGCAHSGVVNTLNYISELAGHEKIHAVFGGMHLAEASQERLESTAKAFARYDVRVLGPCHCTGNGAMNYFRTRFPGQYVECMTGATFMFGGI